MVRERLQADVIEVSVDPPLTASRLLAAVGEVYPGVAPLLASCRVASNQQFCAAEDPIDPEGEVALIPPVSGGCSSVVLTREPIRHADHIEALADPAAGAQCLFTGTVRDHHQGREVSSIQYEAYEEMARTQLEAVAREICERFADVRRVVLVHRFGHLEVGEVSVLVGVSAGHRNPCFEACRHGIDRIKELVPIWKKEFFPDGSAWVGPQ